MSSAAARGAGSKDIVLLKCTSTYPATPENSNLATIPNLAATFGTHVGLSDHTMGGGVAVAAFRPQASTATNGSAAFAPSGQVQGGQVPGSQALPGQGEGGLDGGHGGIDGEQRLSGTVTAVRASSVTIRPSGVNGSTVTPAPIPA